MIKKEFGNIPVLKTCTTKETYYCDRCKKLILVHDSVDKNKNDIKQMIVTIKNESVDSIPKHYCSEECYEIAMEEISNKLFRSEDMVFIESNMVYGYIPEEEPEEEATIIGLDKEEE